jgi:hypothetical protein
LAISLIGHIKLSVVFYSRHIIQVNFHCTSLTDVFLLHVTAMLNGYSNTSPNVKGCYCTSLVMAAWWRQWQSGGGAQGGGSAQRDGGCSLAAAAWRWRGGGVSLAAAAWRWRGSGGSAVVATARRRLLGGGAAAVA